MGKNLHKITELSDESIVGQWLASGRNEYVSALLMRHLPYIYGYYLRTAADKRKARSDVGLFIQRFPSLLQKFGGREDFESWLHGELRKTGDKTDAAISGTERFTECFPDASTPKDDAHTEIIAQLENEVREAYPPQRKRHTGLIILIAAIIAALVALAFLFLTRAAEEPEQQGRGIVFSHPEDSSPVEEPADPTPKEPVIENNAAEPDILPENISRSVSEDVGEAVSGGVSKGVSEGVSEGVAAAAADDPAQSARGDLPYANRVRVVSISEDGDSQDGTHYVSVPKIGLRAYNEYMGKAAVRLEGEVRGDVTLTFSVNRYGRPSRIRVVETLTQEAHREAIRLLDNGPEWSPTDTPVTIVIRFE